jgi:hypothetical protein
LLAALTSLGREICNLPFLKEIGGQRRRTLHGGKATTASTKSSFAASSTDEERRPHVRILRAEQELGKLSIEAAVEFFIACSNSTAGAETAISALRWLPKNLERARDQPGLFHCVESKFQKTRVLH